MQTQNININLDSLGGISTRLKRLELLLGRIMQLTELQAAIETYKAQLVKINAEFDAQKAACDVTVAALNEQVATLQAQLANVALTPEAQAALDALAAEIQALDDKNVDAPV